MTHFRETKSILELGRPDLRTAAAVAATVAVGSGLAYVAVNLRWSYLVACLTFGAFLYLVFVAKALDLALVAYLASLLYVQVLIRGELEIYGIAIGFSEVVLLILVLGYFLHRRITRRADITKASSLRRFNWIYGLYAASMFVSLFYHLDAFQASRIWVTFVLEPYVAFCIAAALFTQDQSARRFLIGLLVFAAFFAFDESAKILLGQGFITIRYPEAEAFGAELVKVGLTASGILPLLRWPGRSGAFMIALLPTAVLLFLKGEDWRLRVVALAVVSSMVLNLLVLRDRGSWVGCLVSLAAIALLSRRSKGLLLLYTLMASVVLLSILLGIITPIASSGGVTEWAQRLADTERMTIWTNIWRGVPSVSPLVGIGWSADLFDSFMIRNATIGSGRYGERWTQIYLGFRHPHNSYLQLLLYAGFPAFITFLMALAYVYTKVIRTLRGRHDTFAHTALLAVSAGALAVSVEAIADLTLWHLVLAGIFWVLMGAAFGLAGRTHVEAPLPRSQIDPCGPRVFGGDDL